MCFYTSFSSIPLDQYTNPYFAKSGLGLFSLICCVKLNPNVKREEKINISFLYATKYVGVM